MTSKSSLANPSAVTVCNTKNMVECLSPLSASTPTSESEHIEDKLASHEICSTGRERGRPGVSNNKNNSIICIRTKQLAMPMQNSASSNSKIKLEVAS